MMMNKGERVRIKETSQFRVQHAGEGRIDMVTKGREYCYHVTWPDDYGNSYRAIDLELVKSETLEDVINDEVEKLKGG